MALQNPEGTIAWGISMGIGTSLILAAVDEAVCWPSALLTTAGATRSTPGAFRGAHAGTWLSPAVSPAVAGYFPRTWDSIRTMFQFYKLVVRELSCKFSESALGQIVVAPHYLLAPARPSRCLRDRRELSQHGLC